MLSYRYLFTKVASFFASFALRDLVRSIARVKSDKELDHTVRSGRKAFDTIRFWLKDNANVEKKKRVKMAGCWVYEYVPKSGANNDRIAIFFHGGGFIIGGDASHGALVSDMAYHLDCRVFLVEYPLAPESKIKNSIDRCVEVIDAIRQVTKCQYYTLVGSSAGGTMVYQSVISLIKNKKEMPTAIYLVAPVIQHCFSFDKETYARFYKTDEILGRCYQYLMENDSDRHKAVNLLGGLEVPELLSTDKLLLKKFPVTHVTYQVDEVLSAENKEFIQQLRDAGITVVDNSVDKSFHSFPIYNYLPHTQEFLQHISADFQKRINDTKKSAKPNG